MLEHHDKLNGSATAFIRAFSDLIKDSTSHLATKDDLDNMRAGHGHQGRSGQHESWHGHQG